MYVNRQYSMRSRVSVYVRVSDNQSMLVEQSEELIHESGMFYEFFEELYRNFDSRYIFTSLSSSGR